MKKLVKEDSITLGYLLGLSVKELAEINKISVSTTYYYLHKNKITKRKKVEPSLINQILEDSKLYPLRALSKKYGIHRTKLCKMINSNSISDNKKQLIMLLKASGLTAYLIGQKLSIETKKVAQLIREEKIKEHLETTEFKPIN